MSFGSWNDVYHELWEQAAQSRGTVTSVGEVPGATRHSTLSEWPRTTGADAIAIASLVDPILSATPLRPGGYGITRLWQTAVIEVESIAFPNPSIEYVHNRALWSTVLAVAAHLSTMGAAVPADEAWEQVLAALWSPVVEHRNAADPVTRTSAPVMRTITAPSFGAMWDAQRGALAQIRGSDLVDDELGGTLDVPRTTSADAIALAGYWSRALIQLQVKVMTGEVPMPDDFEDLQLEWRAVTEDVELIAMRGRSSEVYPRNLSLWRALRGLAAALVVLEVSPAPYELVLSRPAAPTPTPPPRPTPSSPKPTDLSSRLADAADSALMSLAHLVHDAGDRLVTTVGRPLLAAGATVGALLLIMYGTASCSCECDCPSEPTAPTEAG